MCAFQDVYGRGETALLSMEVHRRCRYDDEALRPTRTKLLEHPSCPRAEFAMRQSATYDWMAGIVFRARVEVIG